MEDAVNDLKIQAVLGVYEVQALLYETVFTMPWMQLTIQDKLDISSLLLGYNLMTKVKAAMEKDKDTLSHSRKS